MPLKEYRRKRNFKITSEPAGKPADGKKKAGRSQLSFCVQKHDASHLHYDFRLELDGVLKSWAVPKGPSLDPQVKRLAMQVEDHPLDYGGFEGTIPKGQYGGGTVMLWDRGTWEPTGDAEKDLREGHLKFQLHGQKLRGGWMLVRRGGKHAEAGERHWFLFKEHDEFADAANDITVDEPLSVKTGRDLDEIAGGRRMTGKANRDANAKRSPRSAKKKSAQNPLPRGEGRVRVQGNRHRHPHPGPLPEGEGEKVAVVAKKKPLAKGKSGTSETVEVAGVRLSHPDKVMYADVGITKLDLAHHYELVADWMLPHVADRLLSLVRCPEGAGKPCFFQKHPGQGSSDHFLQTPVKEKSKTEIYLAVDDLAGLISLVQMGVLEIHTWGSKGDHFEQPDRLIFDLDPDPAVGWPQVVAAAREVKLLLEQFDMKSFVKTTGGKGLHVVVPIRRGPSWTEAKAFSRAVADLMVRAAPERYLATMSKAKRKGKIFVDYLRNDRGATSIAPYSTRARAGAPVSVPLSWEELSAEVKSDQFTVETLPKRLAKLKRDPWEKMLTTKQRITKAMVKKLTEQ